MTHGGSYDLNKMLSEYKMIVIMDRFKNGFFNYNSYKPRKWTLNFEGAIKKR